MDNQLAVKIRAIASVPRLGFNDHFGCMNDTLGKFGIPIAWYTGAFWEKCIEAAIEDSLKDVDWLLTLDYDTLATPQHLVRMLETFGKNPHIDALAANQPRRGTGMPLWTIRGKQGRVELDGPIQASTAHFGFTLLRASSLRDLPKPWFFPVAAEDGSCRGKGHIDADIAFWKRWEAAGKTLFIEPSVCIGHIEAMVSMFEQKENPDGSLEISQTFITCPEWRKRFSGSGGMASLGEQETR